MRVEDKQQNGETEFQFYLPKSDLSDGVSTFGVSLYYDQAGGFKELTWCLLMDNLDSFTGSATIQRDFQLVNWKLASCDKPELSYTQKMGEAVEYSGLLYQLLASNRGSFRLYIVGLTLGNQVHPFLQVKAARLLFPETVDAQNHNPISYQVSPQPNMSRFG